MMSCLSMWLNCWLTCVPIHESYMCTFLFKLLTHVPLHEGHMYHFLFKTQTNLLSSLSFSHPSLSRALLRSHRLTLLSLSPSSLSHHLFPPPLSFPGLSLSLPSIINPNCFDLACLRYSMKLKLCMSIN
jgi:hypothetical protein